MFGFIARRRARRHAVQVTEAIAGSWTLTYAGGLMLRGTRADCLNYARACFPGHRVNVHAIARNYFGEIIES